MELSAKYIYEVYKCKSVTVAARNLYVSQPALSSCIKKAEKSMGFRVFDRSTTPFTLTPEGKIYIDSLEKILQIENEANNRIKDISEMKNGTIIMGSSSYAASFLLPMLIKKFNESYPRISFQILLKSTSVIKSMMSENLIDISFGYGEPCSECCCIPFYKERFVIAANKKILTRQLIELSVSRNQFLSGKYDPKFTVTPDLFENIEFVSHSPRSNIYNIMKSVFDEHILFSEEKSNTNELMINYNLMRMGVGAVFTTDTVVATMPPDSDCCYFALDDNISRTVCMYYRNRKNESIGRIINELNQYVGEVYDYSCRNEGSIRLAREYTNL